VNDWQGFYTSSQVSRLTGVPLATLNEWRRRKIVRPSLQLVQEDLIADEGYSYADVTLIRVLRALREHRLTFDSAGKALRHMYERLGPPGRGWANERVYVEGNRIYVDRPHDEWGATDATQLGQKVEPILFGDLFEELRQMDEGASILVPSKFQQYVQINPAVMGGEPVIRNTRVPTAVVRVMLQKYKTVDRLARIYRTISKEALSKALEYEAYLDRRTA
jgi:uncharacterized protein (DUF433 family)